MHYTPYIPAAPLNAYIDDIYYVDGPAPDPRLKILPMPSLHLMVNFGQAFLVHDTDAPASPVPCTESWCAGLWSRPYTVDWPAQVRFYGIHFKPGGAYPFLRMPLSELHNQVVPLDAVYGRDAGELRERLDDAPSIQAGFRLIERLLLSRLGDVPYGLDLVQSAASTIARHHGAVSIRALSDDIGISQNHLETQFKRMAGITPKALARFYRFARALRLIDPSQPVNWIRIARQCHFYDQSHFNREFIALTGHTPEDYLRLLQHVPEAPQTPGQLPID